MKKLTTRILSALLPLLGFTACENNGEVPAEYGTPSVDYQVKGQVTDTEGKPIKGIQVIVENQYGGVVNDQGEYIGYADTLHTDTEGNFESHKIHAVGIGGKIHFKDIDNEENGGSFSEDSVAMDSLEKRQVAKGDGHWYQGRYELTANKQLTKEEPKQD